eukprot:Phypoly_transcript_11839.p1 GENE.Phypoly_transcript_11839~~Phypoly_transcript_11839.p1  ORF type:complete len:351 (+),score=56.21 Phypoly_transcript_11839:76-1128(+)
MAEDDSSSSSESFNSDISISEDVNVPSTNANQLDTSSSTLEEDSPDDPKQGYIELKDFTKKNKLLDKWKLSWCLLDGSSLFIYKNYEKTTPYLTLDLRTLTLGEENHHNRQFSVSLQTTDHHKWIACVTAVELQAWRGALLRAKEKDPVPVPVSRPVPPARRTNTSLYRIKKSMAGRAATTKMGEVLLMKMFGDEIHHLFATVKKIIAKHHSKEIAARVHKVLIRITIKIAFLFEKKVLNVSSLAEVDRPLREAIELLSKYYNARVRRFPRAFPVVETFARIEQLSRQAEDELTRKIQPYVSPKNLANIHFLFETVANGPFLQKVFSDPELADELDELDDVITSYTQFHI